MTLGELINLKAEEFGDHVAFVQPGEVSLTYKVFNQKANQLANFLLHKGLKKGDKIRTHTPNSSTDGSTPALGSVHVTATEII